MKVLSSFILLLALPFVTFLSLLLQKKIFKIGHSLEKHLRVVSRLSRVSDRLTTTFDMLLQDQVISRRHVIVLVSLDTLSGVVNINVVILQLLQNVDVDR